MNRQAGKPALRTIENIGQHVPTRAAYSVLAAFCFDSFRNVGRNQVI